LDASMMRRILALLTKYSSARRFLSNSDIFRRNGGQCYDQYFRPFSPILSVLNVAQTTVWKVFARPMLWP
jgi:hypothetical protein